MKSMLQNKEVLLIVTGGIAAYRSLELVRKLRECGAIVTPVLTESGAHFVTPLSLSTLAGRPVYENLFSLTEENEMGHIRLARDCDCVCVAPATAHFIAKMAHGLADDLASTLLLVTTKPIFIVPAMNPSMWAHPATQDNLAILRKRGIHILGPNRGVMACGEMGLGRMWDPEEIVDALQSDCSKNLPLNGKRVLITGGPTREAMDPVRFLSNRSSGKQGHALALSFARAGAKTKLVTGPTSLPDPVGVSTIHVETANEMLAACEDALPVDIAICAAAVTDWQPVTQRTTKIKKSSQTETLVLKETPDILAMLARRDNQRPTLVIGFAAETEHLIENACVKLMTKNCDWIVANEVGPQRGFDQDENEIVLIQNQKSGEPKIEQWPRTTKTEIASKLVEAVIRDLNVTER